MSYTWQLAYIQVALRYDENEGDGKNKNVIPKLHLLRDIGLATLLSCIWEYACSACSPSAQAEKVNIALRDVQSDHRLFKIYQNYMTLPV